MKKGLTLALAVMLAAVSLAGCGNSGNTSNGGGNNSAAPVQTADGKKTETVTIKYVVPGTEPRDYKEVIQLINEKLAADGVGVALEKVYIPSDAWDQKLNLMLSTGENFDLFHIMQDRTPFSSYYNRGALADISESIEKYGQNLKKYIPDDIFDGAKIDGNYYAVPSYWVEMSSEGEFNIRRDILRQNNLQEPTNPDELISAWETVMKNWKGSNKPYYAVKADFDPVSLHTTILHRTYDTFPFTVKDKFFYVNQNGDVKSWIETEEFKKDAEFMRKLYTKGLTNPDILVIKQEQAKAQLDSGDWFVNFGTGGNLGALKKNNPEATVDDIGVVWFNPEKVYLRPLTFKNGNAVPVNSKHPDEAVKFMDWMLASQDNYDLVQYGIEGKHYTKDGDKGMKAINDPDNNNKPGYKGSESQNGNVNFMRFDLENSIPENNKVLYEPNPDAVNSIAANFVFDPTNVRTEYTNIVSEASASITPIYMGVQEFDKTYPAALDKMKKAGLDKVVEEYQRQFKEYQAAQGK
ncbi:extracellular solute-binding protein [Paenibacillus typhae]|uniref:Carbohydrate ABC transporter substrate-binding protein, CUT1 family n=1 Tax=Paenibacillus typhae TaxID=1174501 RepID=A0A1G9AZH8_9BACL|nr:extracellular solute-binding protein [Paenibacillus typhae]SDK32643.1 carbohydrate ABC transporter substrate-binding protein, CUT1 family [Paenibacillus typhae]